MEIESHLFKVSKIFGYKPKNIQYIYGSNSIVAKFDSNNLTYAFKISLIDSLMTEVYFINTLKNNSIPCQELMNYDFSNKIIPFSFIITKWINSDSFVGHVDDEISINGGQEYGKGLIGIHKIELGGFGVPLDINGTKWSSPTWNKALESFFKKNIRSKTPLKIFDTNIVETIIDKTYRNTKLSIPVPYLIHGDLPNSLATISPKIKLLAFIDPGGIIGGDPMFDLSFVYTYNKNGDFGNGFMKGLISGYTDIRKLTNSEMYRFNHLKLFHLFWKTCFYYDQKWNHEYLMSETHSVLKQLK